MEAPSRRLPPTPSQLALAEALKSLARLECEALAVYRQHGLPSKPGHYARAPGQAAWRAVTRAASPEERWAQLIKRPPEAGWRFAALADVGRITHPDHADVRLASDVIEAAHRWRARLREEATTHTAASATALNDAIRLVELNAALIRTSGEAAPKRLRLLPIAKGTPASKKSVPR